MSEFAEGYAMGADRNNNCGFMPWGMGMGMGGGFGGWGGDWLAIIVLAALFGGGGWGFGGFGGGGGGGIYGDIQRGFDTSGINNKLNGIENGLCDGFFNQATNTQSGFAAVQNALCQGFNGVNTAIYQNGYDTRTAITDVGYALKDCCCQTQRAIDGVNYNLATQSCETRRAIEDNTNRVIAFLTNEKIDSLRTENAALTAQLSQNAQTDRIINRLAPYPIPAYPACPPTGPYNWGACGGGNSCGGF